MVLSYDNSDDAYNLGDTVSDDYTDVVADEHIATEGGLSDDATDDAICSDVSSEDDYITETADSDDNTTTDYTDSDRDTVTDSTDSDSDTTTDYTDTDSCDEITAGSDNEFELSLLEDARVSLNDTFDTLVIQDIEHLLGTSVFLKLKQIRLPSNSVDVLLQVAFVSRFS